MRVQESSDLAVVETDGKAATAAAVLKNIASIPLAELKREERDAKIHIQSIQTLMVRSQVLDKSLTEEQQALGSLGFFQGIAPADTIEEMMAIQMIGLHNAVVESLQRSGHPAMPNDCTIKYLNSASKTSRAFAALVEAMDKHRGDRQQKVLVEHVHVHAGGQAIVGNVEGVGVHKKTEVITP